MVLVVPYESVASSPPSLPLLPLSSPPLPPLRPLSSPPSIAARCCSSLSLSPTSMRDPSTFRSALSLAR
eukprot:2604413-Rhodomonas_salina.1